MRRALSILILLLTSLSISFESHAWYDHTAVMDILTERIQSEIPQPIPSLNWSSPVPRSSSRFEIGYQELASLLLLNPKAVSSIKSRDAVTLRDTLRFAAEDPDHGIDSDLPDSADPSGDRTFMGGVRGPGSQGFRHMFWPGWNWQKPVKTFQYPARPMGQAIDRIDLLAREARERVKKGDLFWGLRILGWTLHYIQDLTQPFHTTQVPSPEMLPYSEAFRWPPLLAFQELKHHSIRSITNYHWAYEGYVRAALLEGESSPFRNCLIQSGGSILVQSPRDLAMQIVQLSIDRSGRTGRALTKLVGNRLKDPDINVPIEPAILDTDTLLKDPKKVEERENLNRVTCESLRLAADASLWIVRWVLAH